MSDRKVHMTKYNRHWREIHCTLCGHLSKTSHQARSHFNTTHSRSQYEETPQILRKIDTYGDQHRREYAASCL